MKLRSRIVAMASGSITLLAGAFTNHARAEWEYTKWGMSPAEVVEASGGKAKMMEEPAKSPKRDDVCKVNAQHTPGNHEFAVSFCFDPKTGKLTSVFLVTIFLPPEKCDLLRDELRRKYGSPQPSPDGTEALWHVAKDHNRIALSSFIDDSWCLLEYSDSSH